MLEVLLESRSRHQPRTGGAALSVGAHVAIVGAIAAAAVQATGVKPTLPIPQIIHFRVPAPDPVRTTRPASTAATPRSAIAPVDIPQVLLPAIAPAAPQLAMPAFGAGAEPPAVGFGGASHAGPIGILGVWGDRPGETVQGVDLVVRILTTEKPRYPELLRNAQVEGSVLVRFVVDTTGRVEMSYVQVLSTTHELFTRAVLEALPRFRFKPAEVRGRRIRMAGEIPFEFSLTRKP